MATLRGNSPHRNNNNNNNNNDTANDSTPSNNRDEVNIEITEILVMKKNLQLFLLLLSLL